MLSTGAVNMMKDPAKIPRKDRAGASILSQIIAALNCRKGVIRRKGSITWLQAVDLVTEHKN